MYLLIEAYGVKLGTNQRWSKVDTAQATIKQLLEAFRELQFTLKEKLTSKVVFLDASTLLREYSTVNTLASVFFQSLALPLKTKTTSLLINNSVAMYCDAFSAGYSATPVTRANIALQDNRLREVTDVRLTHKANGLNYATFANHCLVSVNGFFHLPDTDGVNGIVVSDAMNSVKLSGRNHIGIYSFKEIGAIKLVPITKEMLLPSDDVRKISIFIDQDIGNKQVLISLGGYLHWIDNQTITRTGDKTIKVDFSKIPLLERYYESRRFIDLSGLPTNNTPANPTQIGSKDAWTAEFLAEYLQLSQSFVVILDKPSIYVEKHPLRDSKIPDTYVHYTRPLFPLVSHWGRCNEYIATEDDDHYLLTTSDCSKENYLFNTIDNQAFLSVSDALDPDQRREHSDVWLLEIGTETH